MLEKLVGPLRRQGVPDCIVPFLGWRDTCYGLHMVAKELGMNPITYTYDCDMVTDLDHRNVGRMHAALGVENKVIAVDIEQERETTT